MKAFITTWSLMSQPKRCSWTHHKTTADGPLAGTFCTCMTGNYSPHHQVDSGLQIYKPWKREWCVIQNTSDIKLQMKIRRNRTKWVKLRILQQEVYKTVRHRHSRSGDVWRVVWWTENWRRQNLAGAVKGLLNWPTNDVRCCSSLLNKAQSYKRIQTATCSTRTSFT